ncbi:MAG: L-threonylcarbamoyladenylate synthase [Bacteroidota bacterium]
MLLRLNPQNPQARNLEKVVACLKRGGVIIYPTDTLYGLGCDIRQKKAVERICRIKGIDLEKSSLSCICEDLKVLGQYTTRVDTPVFKLMKRAFPGPFTFILQASKDIPRHFQHKKTVGIRIPEHSIPALLNQQLGGPIASISIPTDEEQPEFHMDPELIHERFGHLVDMVVDGGYGGYEPSTVIDCSQGEAYISVIREGAGDLGALGLDLA